MIDITKPLELSDGTRVEYNPMTPAYAQGEGWADFKWYDGNKAMCSNFMLVDGSSRLGIDHRTLRNVRQPATGVECVERMEALLRRMAAVSKAAESALGEAFACVDEAREMIALLPEVEPQTDNEWALHIVLNDGSQRTERQRAAISNGSAGHDKRKLALACIAKGRELALAGARGVSDVIRYNTLIPKDMADFIRQRAIRMPKDVKGYAPHAIGITRQQAFRICDMIEQLDRLLAALTPSADTKAAYMGEVETDVIGQQARTSVDWTAIKAIMALIRKEAGV